MAGTQAPVEGMGIVPMSFPGSNHLYLLYPSYHMPNNPQDTLSLSALKSYSEARSVRIEALSWVRVVSNGGDSV